MRVINASKNGEGEGGGSNIFGLRLLYTLPVKCGLRTLECLTWLVRVFVLTSRWQLQSRTPSDCPVAPF
jgi:hypothetical protein